MSKVFYLSLIFLFFSAVCFAQNLVPNPSFEQYDTCPNSGGPIIRALEWTSFNSTPEYMNACAELTSPDYSVPYNQDGYQPASTGQAYCALGFSFVENGVREAIGSQLSSDLVIGQKYVASVNVSPGFNYPPGAVFVACNKIGIKFSTVPYSFSNPVPITNFAHIYTDSIVSDTIRWTTISGSFIADSAYRYIIIGIFFDKDHVDTLRMAPMQFGAAYYYIDDVYVEKDTSVSINEFRVDKPTAYLADDKLILKNVMNSQARIIDQNGKIVVEENIKTDNSEIPIQNIATAIFYVIIIATTSHIVYKFYKNQNQ